MVHNVVPGTGAASSGVLTPGDEVSLSLSCTLSHTHAHARTHTHTHAHAHTHTYTHTQCCAGDGCGIVGSAHSGG